MKTTDIMNIIRNSIKGTAALLGAALVMAGCQREGLAGGDSVNFGDGQIRYSVSVAGTGVRSSVKSVSAGSLSLVSADGKLSIPVSCEVSDGISLYNGAGITRGTLINTGSGNVPLDSDSTFTVNAYNDDGDAVTSLFSGTASCGDGHYWTMEEPQYWNDDIVKLVVFANANSGENGVSVNSEATAQTLKYTVRSDASAQQDILLGYGESSSSGTTIPVTFYHPLTAVQFKMGELTDVTGIRSITLSGLASGANFVMTSEGVVTWTVPDNEQYKTSVTLDGGESGLDKFDDNILGIKDAAIAARKNCAFLLVPQNLALDGGYPVSVTAVLMTEGDDITVTADITANSWESGKTNTYTLGYSGSSEDPNLLKGKFSVSQTEFVRFSCGNLQATYNGSEYTFDFAKNQYDFIGANEGNTTIQNDGTNNTNAVVDLFGWSTGATNYGIDNSESETTYSGGFMDWGTAFENKTLWYTLSGGDKGEWVYILNKRATTYGSGGLSSSNRRYAEVMVNDLCGLLIFPDEFAWPSSVDNEPTVFNASSETWNDVNYSLSDFKVLEDKGCVFLPAARNRQGITVGDTGKNGYYWSSTTDEGGFPLRLYFNDTDVSVPADGKNAYRHYGFSVRLVQKFKKIEVKPTFVDLGLPSGTLWADVNVGATSKTGEDSYGKYFAWGETATKEIYTLDNYKYYSSSSYTKYNETDKYKTLLPADDAAFVAYGEGNIPTRAQYEELLNSSYTTCEWKENYLGSGINGMLVVSKINSNSIFFPAAGLTEDSGNVLAMTNGCYWSSDINPTPSSEEGCAFPACAIDMDFDSSMKPFVYQDKDASKRFSGQSIRAVKRPEKQLLLTGRFSVSEESYVQFSRGNLVSTDLGDGTYEYSFEYNQFDFRSRAGKGSMLVGNYSTTAGTPENTSGMFQWNCKNNVIAADYGAFTSGGTITGVTSDTLDWGKAFGPTSPWYTMTSAEWNYFVNERPNAADLRKVSTVCGVKGLVFAPDGYLGTIETDYNAPSWHIAEENGLIFLPMTGYYNTSSALYNCGSDGYYWASDATENGKAVSYRVNQMNTKTTTSNRAYGCTVRLVQKFPKELQLPGLFSVSAGTDEIPGTTDDEYVHFAKGNLYSVKKGTSAYVFYFEQEQYYFRSRNGSGTSKANVYSAGALQTKTPSSTAGTFQWACKNTSDGTSYSPDFGAFTTASSISGANTDMLDFGKAYCNDGTWFTLSDEQWSYLLNRTASDGTTKLYQLATVCGVKGLLLAPDNWLDSNAFASSYDAATWPSAEKSGLVFLPIGCYYQQNSGVQSGNYGFYWTSTAYASDNSYAESVDIYWDELPVVSHSQRRNGPFVRLVCK